MPWHDTFWGSVLSAIVFGLLGIILIMFGYKLFDWSATKIDVQVELAEKHNIAVAIVVAAVMISISIVIAASISG